MKRVLFAAFLALSCGPEPEPVDPNNVDRDGDIKAMCESWRTRCDGGEAACCDLANDSPRGASCVEVWTHYQDSEVAYDIPCMTEAPCASVDEC